MPDPAVHIDTPPSPGIANLFKEEIARLDQVAQEPTPEEQAKILCLKKALIDPNIEPDETPMIASIGDSALATIGNFSAIIGRAKSKKTFFVTIIVAAFLKEFVGVIQAYKATGKKRIVWFDTEQSRHHVLKAYRRAIRLSNEANFHEIEVYDLRAFSPKERQELIDYVLRDQNKEKDIALAVIDGIRDLVSDINDPEQATEVVTWLMKVTADQQLHICTVIHQNKGDSNARGHLGTEIVNKAETVVSVQKESDSISIVKAEFCRDKEFQPFGFTIDDSGLPQILESYTPNEGGSDGNYARGAKTYPSDVYHQVMAMVFSFREKYSYGDLSIQTGLQCRDIGYPMGDHKVRAFIVECLNKGIISKEGKDKSPSAKYYLTPSTEAPF